MSVEAPILLGEFLVSAGLSKPQHIDAALKRGCLTGLPVGLELVLMATLEFDMLLNGIIAQSQVRDGLLAERAAIDALALSSKKNIQLKVALDVMGVDFASDSKNRLGAILTDAGLVDRVVLKQCLGLCKTTGLPLGRILIASGVLQIEILDKAVKLQKLLRGNEVDRESALDDLQSIKSFLGSVSSVANSSSHPSADLSSLLLDAGLLDAESVETIQAGCRQENIEFDEALSKSGRMCDQMTAAAKILLKMIRDKSMSYRAGVDLLKRVNDVQDLQKTVQEVESQAVVLTFADFLMLTRLSTRKTISPGPIERHSEKSQARDEMEQTWQVLRAVPEEEADLAKSMPADVIDCLERNGYLTPESKLDVATAARQYKLFRKNELNIDQALVTYHLAKQERQSMPTWSGTFPSLSIWLPRVQ